MATVSTPVLHYVYDPLCGWCYGAAPLLHAAQAIEGLAIVLHGGGMMSGAKRQNVNDNLRRHVMAHDQRIAQATGQPFGAAYVDGLLRDTGAVFDSTPPTTAIVAAQEIAGLGLAMLHLVQHAHYVLGQRVAEAAVLAALVQQLGIAPDLFAAAYGRLAGAAIERHIAHSRALLARLGGQGFPTLAIEYLDGRMAPLELGNWLGRTEGWTDYLRQQLSTQTQPGQASGGPACGLGGCAL
ncbi:DsbA family protein [Janthinobacterium sp. PC23-8]|uniref:DsbA family protein n=1 Tax=Janthinobacterium sp. PC23-8 TaxID=2012679 RepID=UPI000B970A48|nr:DsbA family protein [Janthinobacterium sp. PC23-8]OYO30099.1 protein-disulfide isomerase [Janthinobacterium sp. PC23-8]